MIRFLVYGICCVLAALFVAAFVSTSLTSSDKKNEITIGSIGEATKLNPIQSAETGASEVEGFIFEGLLQYDQNLEVTTLLAKSFTLDQTTTFFFRSPEGAAAGLALVEAQRETWAEWTLQEASVADSRLILKLTQPGLEASRKILTLFDKSTLFSLSTLRVEPGKAARERLAALRAAQPDLDIQREWFDYDAAFEIVTTSPADQTVQGITSFLGPDGGTAVVLETVDFLAEPVVRFLLRDDVRWHDGEPFTSRDVAFTYQSLVDEAVASPRKANFDLVQSLETPGPYEVIVTYRKPFSPALSSWMMPLIPAHILDGKPVEWWDSHFNRNPIGTGPFKFSEWKTNEFIRLVRNPDYWQGGPWLDGVVFRVLPDPISLRLAFETRQIDFWSVDPWAVGTFQDDPRFTVFQYPGGQYSYVGWNLRNPLFQDVRVRQAFAHAVNVPQMIDFILYGNGVQSTGIFPPHFWFSNPSIKPLAFDPEKAGQLLDEAGWKKGPDGIRARDGKRLEFTLISNQGNEVRKDIATLVQDNLRALGVGVKVEIYEWTVFISRFVNKGEFDAVVLGWTTPPDYDAYQVWHSSQSNPEQLNFVHYKNSRVDVLLDQIRQEYDPETIKRMAAEIQSLIYEDQPYLFLYVPQSTSVIWKDSFRIRRPTENGWVDTPVEITKAGWTYYMQWFYRPEFADRLPAETQAP